jgi:hypothetical protein
MSFKIFHILLVAVLFLCACKKSSHYFYTTAVRVVNSDNSWEKPDTNNIQHVSGNSYMIRIKSSEHVIDPIDKEYTESVWYFQKYNLTNLTVRSLNTFDSTHLAGSDISEYFLTDYGMQYTIEEFISSKRINEKYRFSGYTENFHTSIDLMLMQAPAIKGRHDFVIQMNFDNGNTFKDTTSIILL